MVLWWFMLVTSRKPTNMSIAILNFAIWEVQIQIRTLCRTCKRKVGCCGRCLLMRKIGMNDRWVHSFETSPDVVPDFDWLCRCDLKIFEGACKRRCGDSQHSRKSHWRPPHHWKRQGHGFNAVPANEMFVFGGFNLSSSWPQFTFRFLLGTFLSQASPTCLQPAPGPGPMGLTFRRWSSFPTPSVCGRRPWVWRHRAGDFLDQRRGTQVCRMVEVGFKNHQSPRFFLQVSDFDWYLSSWI